MKTYKNMICVSLGLVMSVLSLNLYARAEKQKQDSQESREAKAALQAGQEIAAEPQGSNPSSRPESPAASNPKSKWQLLRENRGIAARQNLAVREVSQQDASTENTPSTSQGGLAMSPGRNTNSPRILVKSEARVYAQKLKRDNNVDKKGRTKTSAAKTTISSADAASQTSVALPQETQSLMILSGDKATAPDIRKSAIKKLADRTSADKVVQTQLVQIAHDTTEEQSVRQGAIEAFTDGTTGRTRLMPNSEVRR